MAVVPVVPAITGGVLATSEQAALAAVSTFLLRRPHAQLRQIVNQSLANLTWASITFTTEDVDDDVSGTGGHSNSTNPSRFTALYAGWYLLGGTVAVVASATGSRGARWAVNGSAIAEGATLLPAIATVSTQVPAPVVQVYLNVGDYVELQGFQNSGGALNTDVTAGDQSSMSVLWISN